LIIAIDYDDTFSADPEFWTFVIEHGKSRGHAFVCVTARCGSPEDRHELREALPNIPFHFSCDEPKADYARRYGLGIDVWIDDMPGWIVGVP